MQKEFNISCELILSLQILFFPVFFPKKLLICCFEVSPNLEFGKTKYFLKRKLAKIEQLFETK